MKISLLFLCIFAVFWQEFDSTESSVQMNGVKSDSSNIHSRKRRDISGSSSYFYYEEPHFPRDCKEVYEQCDGQTESGVFMIHPDGAPEPFNVHCNNSIDGGGWTVFQRRLDGAVDFFRRWDDYKSGFGFLQREFWLGNDKISYITNQGDYELRIDLVSRNDSAHFVKYDLFRITDEISKYRMTDLGTHSPESTTDYILFSTYNKNRSFSTWDQDNDRHSTINCASYHRGAWWFSGCYPNSHLNGLYFDARDSFHSIRWNNLTGGDRNIKYVEMKLRSLSGN